MDAFSCIEEFILKYQQVRKELPNAGDVTTAIFKECDIVQAGLYSVGEASSDAKYQGEVQKLMEALFDLSYACLVAAICFRSGDWKDAYLANHGAILNRIEASGDQKGLLSADGPTKLERYFDDAATAKFIASGLFKRI